MFWQREKVTKTNMMPFCVHSTVTLYELSVAGGQMYPAYGLNGGHSAMETNDGVQCLRATECTMYYWEVGPMEDTVECLERVEKLCTVFLFCHLSYTAFPP